MTPLVHEIIGRHARRRPDATALRCDDDTVTYGELDRWSDAFAELLREAGAGPDRLVALVSGRSTAAVAALLGVLKSGAAYVPVDPDYPEARIAHILRTVEPDLIRILHDDTLPPLADPALATPLSAVPRRPASAVPPARIGAGQLAYVVFTSGSTGAPKGVMIEHGSLAAVVPELVRAYGIGPDDRVLHCAPLGFDTSISEVLRCLCGGAELVILTPAATASAGYLMRLRPLAHHGVTKAVLPAALLRALPRIDLPRLDTLVATGEACTAELVDRWAPGRRLLNAYGSTEGTFATTIMECEPGAGKPMVGRPIATAEVFVVDPEDGREVPPGEVGEVVLTGAGVGRGYYRNPELTAARFVPNRWGSRSPTAFRTGDLGRFHPDGVLECLGRIDDQVKIRGTRVDLNEVEGVLRRHPQVREAAVVTRAYDDGTVVLVGHVAVTEARDDLVQRLHEHLLAQLPDAAVPRQLHLVERLPLTAHGKVDRALLRGTATPGS